MPPGVHNAYSTTPDALTISEPAGRSASDRARFWAKVDVRGPDECWLWTATVVTTWAYGYFGYQKAPGQQGHVYAHRYSWELANGPIPDGLQVCHRCDVPRCVNPAHLFLGTHTDNMRDASRKGRLSVPRPSRQIVSDDVIAEMVAHNRNGVRQVDIAERFGVSRAFVCLVLKGQRRRGRPSQHEQGRA